MLLLQWCVCLHENHRTLCVNKVESACGPAATRFVPSSYKEAICKTPEESVCAFRIKVMFQRISYHWPPIGTFSTRLNPNVNIYCCIPQIHKQVFLCVEITVPVLCVCVCVCHFFKFNVFDLADVDRLGCNIVITHTHIISRHP